MSNRVTFLTSLLKTAVSFLCSVYTFLTPQPVKSIEVINTYHNPAVEPDRNYALTLFNSVVNSGGELLKSWQSAQSSAAPMDLSFLLLPPIRVDTESHTRKLYEFNHSMLIDVLLILFSMQVFYGMFGFIRTLTSLVLLCLIAYYYIFYCT